MQSINQLPESELRQGDRLYSSKEAANLPICTYSSKTLAALRSQGNGPKFFKNGEAQSSRVFYTERHLLQYFNDKLSFRENTGEGVESCPTGSAGL